MVLVAATATAAVAAVVTAGVVVTPWSHGHPAAAAYAVVKNADGSVTTRVGVLALIDPAQLAALNAKLADAGVRAVYIADSADGQCTTPVAKDPAVTTEEQWASGEGPGPDGTLVITGFTEHMDQYPAGDTVVIAYELGDPAGPLKVRTF
jgi:hypothetical protein